MERRDFIKKTSIASLVTIGFADPLLSFFSKTLNVSAEEYFEGFSAHFDFLRAEDLCHFRFYFVNARRSGNRLKREKQEGKKPVKPMYMIVRLPQQHISEATVDIQSLPNAPQKAYVSGFSYLTFRLKEDVKSLKVDPDDFLDWSQFDLVTLDDDVIDQSNLKSIEMSGYPEEILSSNAGQAFFFDAGGGMRIPVTLLEVPYKLFLSPVSPKRNGISDHEQIGYIFEDQENQILRYYEGKNRQRTGIRVIRPWENELQFISTNEDAQISTPPSFKAVGYVGDGSDSNLLIPSGKDRKEISSLTLLDFKADNRDIHSDYFKLGAIGASSFLKYKNYHSPPGIDLVGWKQEIKNGRDVFAEIIKIGRDMRTGKKVLVSTIGERINHLGKSLWVSRYYLKFLDKSRTYTQDSFPYTASQELDGGFYFRPVEVKPNKTSISIADFKVRNNSEGGGLALTKPFIPVAEDSIVGEPLTNLDKVRIHQHKYLRTDHQGATFITKSHLFVIFKSQFENDEVKDYMKSYNLLITNKSGDFAKTFPLLKERFEDQKIGYVPAKELDGAKLNKNTTLKTENFQFTSEARGTDFYDENVVQQHLQYAKIIPPQIEGFADIKPQHFQYTDKYLTDGHQGLIDGDENSVDNGVFFKSITAEIETDFKKNTAKTIENVFNQNLDKVGNLINSDIQIDGLSIREQGVTLKEDTTILGKQIKPIDILRGAKAEIFNGINLVDILSGLIPLDKSPVFDVIEKADEGFQLIREYRTEYNNLKKNIEEFPRQIKALEADLYAASKTDLERYIEKRLELEKKYWRTQLDSAIIRPLRKKLEAIIPSELISDLYIGIGADHIKGITNKILNEILKDYSDLQIQGAFRKYVELGGGTLDNLRKVLEGLRELDPTDDSLSEAKRRAILHIQPLLESYLYEYLQIIRDEHLLVYSQELEVMEGQVDKTLLKLVREFGELQKMMFHFREMMVYYGELKKEYEALELSERDIITICNQLIEPFQAKYENFDTKYEDIVMNLNALGASIGNNPDIKALEGAYLAHKNEIDTKINEFEERVDNYKRLVENSRKKIISDIEDKKLLLRKAKKKLEDFANEKIKELNDELVAQTAQLKEAYEIGEAKVREVEANIKLVQDRIKKLQEPASKTFKYKWQLDAQQFSPFKTSFVSFIPTPTTKLELNVKTDINYQLSLNAPPKYLGTEVYSYNEISNFSLGIFDILNIDFDKISFESGTRIDTDVDVSINDISFGGALNFISAFEAFMDVLNFLQQIANGRIIIDYHFPLPEITAGAFNFVNGKLYAGVVIPIGADKEPMSVQLGVNSPGDLFLVSYGIFGGRGCFQIEMNPRDGVTMVLLVIEFGGVVLIQVGVARGMVYLFAGIYYRKKYDTVVIEGYLVAGGSLNIANLVTASVTFTMKLRGNGHYLVGSCSVRYTVKIGRFFEKSFTLRMKKRLKGAEKSTTKNSASSTENYLADLSTNQSNWETPHKKHRLIGADENRFQAPIYDEDSKYGKTISLSRSEWNNYINSFIEI